MSELLAVFRELTQTGRTAIIGYLPTGFPDVQTYQEIVKAAVSAGLNILEVGLPIDKPVLDGQVIQNALHTIQEHGIDVDQGLSLGAQALQDTGCAGVAMFYANVLETYGPERLLAKCWELNIAGVLPIGMSVAQWLAFADLAKLNNMAVVSFIEWSYDDATILSLLEKTTGFVYVQSSQGATGRKVMFDGAVKQRLEHIKRFAEPFGIPVAVGFGIRSDADVARLNRFGVDGIIVGTALVEAAAKGVEEVRELIASLSAAIV